MAGIVFDAGLSFGTTLYVYSLMVCNVSVKMRYIVSKQREGKIQTKRRVISGNYRRSCRKCNL